jgi:EAL domain-containing protein (putative c-di-GMP-specific phosphodiesterase class I)
LVVDDDPILIEIATSLLRLRGVREVLRANDGAAALDTVAKRTRDIGLILCDLQMPNMDGVAFMRGLGALNFTGSVAIISSMTEGVLSLASQLAISHGLNFLGAVKKPLSSAKLDALLSVAGGENARITRNPGSDIDEAMLRKAIENGEIVAFYQPKLEVSSGRVIGAEALARWRRQDGSLVGPDRFIPLAERTGLIAALDRSVICSAVSDLPLLRRIEPAFAVSVNASALTLGDLQLFDYLTGLLAAQKLDPSALVLEITESQALDKTASLLEVLCRLRLAGFELSIDDFGTGHSNLEALRDFPFTEIKIDRSFVREALDCKRANASVESCLLLGRRMSMHVVAEGVETARHWQLLEQKGASAAQGYYIAKPMPLDACLEWMRARSASAAAASTSAA